MSVATLKLALAAEREKALNKQIGGLKKQLAETVAALDRSRRVRRVKPIAPARKKPRLKGDRIRAGFGDTHGMRVDHKVFSAIMGDFASIQPHEIILLGDHADCGGFLAQHHTLGYVAEADYSYEEDIAITNRHLDQLQAVTAAESIEYIEGNHERRVETWCLTQTLRHARDAEFLRRAFAPEHLLRLSQRGISYRRMSEFYDGLDVPGIIKRGNCFFLHGLTTAKHAAFVTRIRTAGNCVHGHTHRAQSDIGRTLNNGVVGVWCPGCACIPQPLWNHTAPTDWTHGYFIQFISHTGKFLHLNVPIVDGESLFNGLIKH